MSALMEFCWCSALARCRGRIRVRMQLGRPASPIAQGRCHRGHPATYHGCRVLLLPGRQVAGLQGQAWFHGAPWPAGRDGAAQDCDVSRGQAAGGRGPRAIFGGNKASGCFYNSPTINKSDAACNAWREDEARKPTEWDKERNVGAGSWALVACSMLTGNGETRPSGLWCTVLGSPAVWSRRATVSRAGWLVLCHLELCGVNNSGRPVWGICCVPPWSGGPVRMRAHTDMHTLHTTGSKA